jgi:non-ribosomal peptide synthetase component F
MIVPNLSNHMFTAQNKVPMDRQQELQRKVSSQFTPTNTESIQTRPFTEIEKSTETSANQQATLDLHHAVHQASGLGCNWVRNC